MDSLTELQRYLERHHGGNGALAAERTFASHQRNHDDVFMAFWARHSNLQPNQSQQIADLGCGPGLFLKDLSNAHPSWQLTGIECAPYMLERIETLPKNIQVRIADLNAPARELFSDATLDLALANRLVHELHQPITLFCQLRHWLKPGGRLLLVDMVRQPIKNYLSHELKGQALRDLDLSPAQLHDLFQHFLEHNRYTSEDLCDLLTLCGFEILEVEAIRSGRAVQIAARNPNSE
ncbi:class I SAM-dependent methyltransferase [Nitrincola tapanii]|nr:class I SAM-dependent methyltransferase [Nitrincola tapanii]